MQGYLQDHMKVGLIHFMAYPACMGGDGPVIDSVRAVVNDPFFDVIEVTQIKSQLVRTQVRAIIDESRIEPYFGAQPIILGNGLDLNHADEAARGRAVKGCKWGIDQAHEMGCHTITVLSGRVSDDKDAALQRLVDSLLQLCAHAQTTGVRVVLETFDQVPYAKNCLIGPTRDAVAVSHSVRETYPEFGLVLDLSHLPLIGESSKEAVQLAIDHLAMVHIGNCAMDNPEHPAYGDNHPRFGADGTRNDVDELAEFLKILQEMGYFSGDARPVVSFEVRPMPGECPESVIAGSKRVLQEAWRRV